jgi:multidrug efflux pump
MNFTDFFIKHPVITLVINAMIIAFGILSFEGLLLREYPKVETAMLKIHTNYSNASAELVENAVTNPLEEKLAGIEGLESIESNTSYGRSDINLVFKEGISIDKAIVATRDAIGSAKERLPKNVREPAIYKAGESGGLPFIGVALSSNSRDAGDLTHYAELFLKNQFKSVEGVASVDIWGSPYMMEIALDPKKLYALGIDPGEIVTSIAKKTQDFPTGKFQDKTPTFLERNLSHPEDFQSIFLKEKQGTPIFLSTVAQIGLKTQKDGFRVRVNQKPGLMMAIEKTPDSNPINISREIIKKVQELQHNLPKDMQMSIVIDKSEFIKASLKNLGFSIMEAIVLVLVIVFIFLRNFRATLIPLVTIPISLIGGIIFLKMFGFSLNTLTLLAMVLAVGLVVDDAIVILENISGYIEKGLSPLEASLKGSREMSFAIIAMTGTLASVYMPLMFIPGVIGQLFIEFAVALSGSVILSGIVALTLSPLMCSRLTGKTQNKAFPQIDLLYSKILDSTFVHQNKMMWIMGGLFLSMIGFFMVISKAPIPKEDRGIMGVYIPTIQGKSLDDLEQVMIQIEEKLSPYVKDTKSMFSFMGPWGGDCVLILKDQGERPKTPVQIVEEIKPKMAKFPSLDAWAWSEDTGLPLRGQGGGRLDQIEMTVSTPHSYPELLHYLDNLKGEINQKKLFLNPAHGLNLDSSGYKIIIDDQVSSLLGISHSQITNAIEIFFSGNQSLYFQKDNFPYSIKITGQDFPWSLDSLYVVNQKGKKISIGTLAHMEQTSLPHKIEHHNQLRSAKFTVKLAPRDDFEKSAQRLQEKVLETLPEGVKVEFSGGAKMQAKITNIIFFFIGLALVFIYAILAMQFESFLSPLIVLMTVPFAGFGALLTLVVFGESFNIYALIGIITLIGLISKHGILIVEFANQLSKEMSLEEAIQKAAKLRLRPILMTTAAMILGSIPLIISSGAGCEARKVIGLTIVGGLGFGTLFTIFILPGIYLLSYKFLQTLKDRY